MMKYDPDEQDFFEINPKDKNDNNFEFFEQGHFTYLPREFAIAKHEHLGAGLPPTEVESDLDFEDEDDDVDPAEEFKKAATDIF